jgi:hypothetical protein
VTRITPRFIAGRYAITDRMAEAAAAQAHARALRQAGLEQENARREAYAHCDRAPFGWELRA